MSQVNLLPPSFAHVRRRNSRRSLILGAGVAVLVLLLGYWFLQSQKLSDVNEQVAAQNATNTQIQAQIDQLQQFQQLQVGGSRPGGVARRRRTPARCRSRRC